MKTSCWKRVVSTEKAGTPALLRLDLQFPMVISMEFILHGQVINTEKCSGIKY